MFKSILRRPLLPLLVLPLLLAPVPLPAQTGGAPYSIDGRGFSRLQDAVDAIGEGEGTIRIAPGHHRDCAVQTAGRIALLAAQPGPTHSHGVTGAGTAAP